MKIAVAAEADPSEPRVAATPETVKKMIGLGAEVAVQPGAGVKSGILDADYAAAGATVSADALNGADVVLALRQAGEEIWAVGIDDIYSAMPNQNDEALGNAFDITWLTVVCIKLKEIRQGKKPQVRVKGHSARKKTR